MAAATAWWSSSIGRCPVFRSFCQAARLPRLKVGEIAPDTPVLLTGDFNADQGGRAYRRMVGLDHLRDLPVGKRGADCPDREAVT